MKLFIFICMIGGHLCQEREFWLKEGQKILDERINLRQHVGPAKNVILFLGDGMGVSTITAARILNGQLKGGTGEEYKLHMEKMPHVGLIKTYSVDRQTADSASTATAFLSGVKTRSGLLGVDARVYTSNCTMIPEANLTTILDWSLAEGKSVGVLSTARITHATPGATYANIAHRDWENDVEKQGVAKCEHVKDIARQLVEDNSNIQVIMGGGRRNFINKTQGGDREDGRDLVQMWKNIQEAKGVKYQYVSNHQQFQSVPPDTDYLFGLFSDSHMDYETDRKSTGPNSQPSLAEMVEKAIHILQKNDKGYFLLVEGGRIDHAHHNNMANKALTDTIAFDEALATAINMTEEEDTFLVATADHSHTFTLAGYPKRGHPIFKPMVYDEEDFKHKTPLDGMPMSPLNYVNGPGPQRTNLTKVDTTDKEFQFPNSVPSKSEAHGGEDVAVFARGPMSHLIGGLHEQNVLAHIMGYVSCVGPNKSLCNKDQRDQNLNEGGSTDTKTNVKHPRNIADKNGGLSLTSMVLVIFSVIKVMSICEY